MAKRSPTKQAVVSNAFRKDVIKRPICSFSTLRFLDTTIAIIPAAMFSSPDVTEMMLATVYSVVMWFPGLEMCLRTVPWTMAPRMKLTWPTRMRVRPFFISLPGPFSLSNILHILAKIDLSTLNSLFVWKCPPGCCSEVSSPCYFRDDVTNYL